MIVSFTSYWVWLSWVIMCLGLSVVAWVRLSYSPLDKHSLGMQSTHPSIEYFLLDIARLCRICHPWILGCSERSLQSPMEFTCLASHICCKSKSSDRHDPWIWFQYNKLNNKQVTFIIGNVYGPVILLAALSILLQYLRVFVPSRYSNRLLYYGTHTLIWVQILFCIIGTFVGVFICNPVQKAWNPFIAGRCLNSKQLVVTVSCLKLFFEVQILILPLRTIWNLHMAPRRKWAISAIFAGGLLYVDFTLQNGFDNDFR